ncbi:50S ribosomal protein L22 [candidate division GN15 bacterium]|nr:50S ribosomal protein L22 [candidate division GN15 bacterium]
MSVRSHLEIGRTKLVPTIKELNDNGEKKLIKTSARQVKITSDFVGHTLDVFNGRRYVRIKVDEEMVGGLLGKYAKRDTPTARLRFLSIPPRKMRQVGDMIKGMKVEKALNILNFTPRIAAKHLAKTVKSAAANILSEEGSDHVNAEDLVVTNVVVEAAPTAKRIRFQSMGRVFRYRKRHCHLSVWVEEAREAVKAREEEEERARKEKPRGGAKKKAAKKTTAKKSTAKKSTAKKATKKTTKKAEKAEVKEAEAAAAASASEETTAAEVEPAAEQPTPAEDTTATETPETNDAERDESSGDEQDKKA